MPSPADRRYTSSHEWHKPEAGQVLVGISEFAVKELTDITFLDIKKKSGSIKAGESFGEIESVKATSELYCAIDGTIVAFNQEVIDNPAIINEDPYGKGWLIKVAPSNAGQIDTLQTAADYDKKHG